MPSEGPRRPRPQRRALQAAGSSTPGRPAISSVARLRVPERGGSSGRRPLFLRGETETPRLPQFARPRSPSPGSSAPTAPPPPEEVAGTASRSGAGCLSGQHGHFSSQKAQGPTPVILCHASHPVPTGCRAVHARVAARRAGGFRGWPAFPGRLSSLLSLPLPHARFWATWLILPVAYACLKD